MSELVYVVNRIYRFIVMKEAFKVGLITANTWKGVVERLITPMIKAWGGADDNE